MGLSLCLEFSDSFKQAGSKLQRAPSHLLPYASVTGEGHWGQSSGPYACTTSLLLTEPYSYGSCSTEISQSENTGNVYLVGLET